MPTTTAVDPGSRTRRAVLHRVQGGQARIGQRRGLDGIEAAECHQVAGRDDHLLGHAAVRRDADRSGHDVAAHVVLRRGARRARAAPEQLVHGHARPPTGGVRRPRRSSITSPTISCPSVTGSSSPRPPLRSEAQVGPADARREHPQHDLARRGPRGRDVDHLRPPGVGQAVGAHVGGQS